MKKILLIIFICIHHIGFSQPIFDAILDNDVEEIEKLAKRKKNLDLISTKYGTPLMAAVFTENIQVTELLIQNGSDVNKEVGLWWWNIFDRYNVPQRIKMKRIVYLSPIDIAVEKGNIEIFEWLMGYDAILNPRVLLRAVERNDTEMLKYLVNYNILKISDSEVISEAIFTAFKNKNTEISDYIIDNRFKNECVSKALILSINNNQNDFLIYLSDILSLKDFFNTSDFDDVITAIIRKEKIDLLKFLEEHGITFNRSKKAYDYYMAAAESDNIQIFEFLDSKGLSPAENNTFPETLFKYAVNNNKPNTLRYFFIKIQEYNTDINLMPENGRNYCSIASKNNFTDICKILIFNGMNPNMIDSYGYTSLDYAILNENEELIKLFIEHKGLTSFNIADISDKCAYTLFYDGTYICGRKESLFYANITYIGDQDKWEFNKFRNDGSLYFSGFYKDNNLTIKTDTFKYYFSDSSIYMIETYENNKLINRNCPGNDYIEDTVIFLYVQKMPEFPGGNIELRRWIAKNIIYPEMSRECGIEGTIFLRFEVKRNGNIGMIELQKGVDPLLDEIAIKTIKKLPRFKPGYQRGIPVNVWYSVPVTFKLN